MCDDGRELRLLNILTTEKSIWDLNQVNYEVSQGWHCDITAVLVTTVGGQPCHVHGDTLKVTGAGDSPSRAFDEAVRDLRNRVLQPPAKP